MTQKQSSEEPGEPAELQQRSAQEESSYDLDCQIDWLERYLGD